MQLSLTDLPFAVAVIVAGLVFMSATKYLRAFRRCVRVGDKVKFFSRRMRPRTARVTRCYYNSIVANEGTNMLFTDISLVDLVTCDNVTLACEKFTLPRRDLFPPDEYDE
jgi:hypothetical protein